MDTVHVYAPANLALAAYDRLASRLLEKSRSIISVLEGRMERVIVIWMATIIVLGSLKIALSTLQFASSLAVLKAMVPYLAIALAPVLGYRVATGSFPRNSLLSQPAIRLCRYGSWAHVDPIDAQKHSFYGSVGFMASLVIGILMNVPLRAIEFALSVPAMAPQAPSWAHALMCAMAVDVIVMSFFYIICFVMALRAVPMFPRMIVFVWCVDIGSQMIIAQYLAIQPGLPADVGRNLHALLEGNIQKTLISACIWFPYLIVSARVNITFRNRIRVKNNSDKRSWFNNQYFSIR